MTDADGAWAAGLFEGEGTVGCGKSGIRLQLAMCDEDIVRRWGDVVGAGRIRGPYGPHGVGTKPQWHWGVYAADDVEAIYIRFRPWLGERRLKQFEEAFEQRREQVKSRRPPQERLGA